MRKRLYSNNLLLLSEHFLAPYSTCVCVCVCVCIFVLPCNGKEVICKVESKVLSFWNYFPTTACGTLATIDLKNRATGVEGEGCVCVQVYRRR